MIILLCNDTKLVWLVSNEVKRGFWWHVHDIYNKRSNICTRISVSKIEIGSELYTCSKWLKINDRIIFYSPSCQLYSVVLLFPESLSHQISYPSVTRIHIINLCIGLSSLNSCKSFDSNYISYAESIAIRKYIFRNSRKLSNEGDIFIM